MTRRRVVVTGLGIVCPIGNTVQEAWAACLAGKAAAAADENTCPAPVRASGTARPAAPEQPETTLGETPIEYEADGVEATRDGEWLLQGEVLIKQGERTLKTRNARYNSEQQSFEVDEDVQYADPNLTVSGTSAEVDQVGGATFEGAKFELKDRNARGQADQVFARDVDAESSPIVVGGPEATPVYVAARLGEVPLPPRFASALKAPASSDVDVVRQVVEAA